MGTDKRERIVGTHLYPFRVFGKVERKDRKALTQVLFREKVNGPEVVATRMGGLFVLFPQRDSDGNVPGFTVSKKGADARLAEMETVASTLNLLICEFTLLGITSEPASPVHFGVGSVSDGHADLKSAAGNEDAFFDRSVFATRLVAENNIYTMCNLEESTVPAAFALERTKVLKALSPTLPSLIPGAYYQFARRQFPEALSDSWIVAEQIINHLWKKTPSSLSKESERVGRPTTRRDSVAHRIGDLLAAGHITRDLCKELHAAREVRNALAHGAVISATAATASMKAMRSCIQLVCKTRVKEPSSVHSIVW